MDANLPAQVTAPSTMPIVSDPHYANEMKGGSIIKKITFFIVILVVIIGIAVTGFILFGRFKTSSKPQNVTLKYWGLWDDVTIMQPVISDFERTHPNIKVQYEKQDIKGLGQYIDRLTTRINNGTGPDVIRFHSSWTRQLKKSLLPFPKDVVDQTKLETDFYKTVERDMKIGGAYYGIPLGIDTLSMFVNTKLLQDKGLPTPKYWNEIYEKYAPELVVKDEAGKIVTPSISLGTYDNITHAPDIVALLLLQNGADLTDLQKSEGESASGAFNFYTSFAQGEDAVWDETLDNSTLAFAKGNLALYFGYSWDIFTIRALNPTLEYEVVKVPALAERTNSVSSYWAEGISSRSKNSKEAFTFIAYLSTPEVLQKIHQTQAKIRPFGILYARKSMGTLLSTNELVYPFVSQADNAESTFFSSDTHDGDNGMISQMNVYLGNAVRSINNNTSVDTAVEILAKGVAQILERY